MCHVADHLRFIWYSKATPLAGVDFRKHGEIIAGDRDEPMYQSTMQLYVTHRANCEICRAEMEQILRLPASSTRSSGSGQAFPVEAAIPVEIAVPVESA